MSRASEVSATNKRLGVAAAMLLLLSALTYWNDVSRADRFESGQKLLPNLDLDQVASIEIAKGEEQATLLREEDRFLVSQRSGYRARNESVNRLLRDVVEVNLERVVGRGLETEAITGLAGEGAAPVEITLANASGEPMVRLRVGAVDDSGGGTFVQRLDGDDQAVYLTSSPLSVTATPTEYLEREIVDVPAAEVVRIEGPDFVIARQGEGSELALVEPKGEGESSEIGKLSSFLNRLRYDEVYLADDPAVVDLEFEQTLRYELADQSGYRVFHASSGDQDFVKIGAFYGVERIEVAPDSSDEELEEKAAVLKRSDEINRFNQYSGSWVYKLATFDAEKLDLRAQDLR